MVKSQKLRNFKHCGLEKPPKIEVFTGSHLTSSENLEDSLMVVMKNPLTSL